MMGETLSMAVAAFVQATASSWRVPNPRLARARVLLALAKVKVPDTVRKEVLAELDRRVKVYRRTPAPTRGDR